jgi:hypothetical protein
MATFSSQVIDITLNNIKMPLVSADDAVTIEANYETSEITNDVGVSSYFDKLKSYTITMKCVRGDNITGGGIMSTSLVPKSLFSVLTNPGQFVEAKIFITNTGRKFSGKLKVMPFDNIKSSASTEITFKFSVINGLQFSSAILN